MHYNKPQVSILRVFKTGLDIPEPFLSEGNLCEQKGNLCQHQYQQQGLKVVSENN